ncbi:hypothetical protein Cfor_01120 [Coptotermes formosanus]|uniref:Mos1 transposase HTH domain-containing protein n=1 Tax=Coptotermes formosanus TaxID=36987 RepID=A0A6L2PY61_COPFO|nr:hypothetical protein Cfor_01120 [Coptotermes formosanus]
MAAPDVEFTMKESREVMKFLFLKGKSAKEIYDDMLVTLDENGPSSSTVKNWVARFKTGYFSTEDEDCPGRPLLFTVPEKMDIIHTMILVDRRIAAEKIAEILEISRERVGLIICHVLVTKKLSAKCTPKCLNADLKRYRVVASWAILEHFRWNTAGFLAELVTMDETWIHLHDPETKEQSEEWRHSGSPCPKKFRTQMSASKVIASVFWDKDGTLLVDYLEKGATITASYYTSLLDKAKQALVSKWWGKLSQGVLFLQDNASSHTAEIISRSWMICILKC